MIRKTTVIIASAFITLALIAVLPACDDGGVPPADDSGTGADDGSTGGDDGSTGGDDGSTGGDDGGGTTPGVLQVKAYTDTLGATARIVPSGQSTPDDVDVNLTPIEYTIAFKRLVFKQVDEDTDETLSEVEVFSADTVDDALIVDLRDSAAQDVLDVNDLPAGTYNQVDIEVFYLEMTVPTIYPASESHDIAYRMVYETMGLLEPRDFLLYLEPEWMEAGSDLAGLVTEAGWYWMHREEPDNVVPVDGATEHPTFPVLDLFADEEFWSSEHKVLEGGRIAPPLEYDPNDGGVLTIEFDLTGKFNFKDYYDDTRDPDGLWEIRYDAGIHPFPPGFAGVPEDLEAAETP